ncbi:MAG TPA: cytochrome d ubiquinol oxidase subunit II [Myxococcota bacterium]|nr:cytochrome d ubiquinol oxidase subunit II [Myxococcota bacterium]HNZ02865.1 cytochrome d ubiquinol oxidase subunit II [Myxococcota bacterium]
MEHGILQIIWFVLYFVLIAVYAVLDGFDLGVGALSLFARDARERGIHMDSIAPVWDGNEVWLLTAGGALFAAFPFVYATVFSGFYLALMLLLVFLIWRAVSFEFRDKMDSPRWVRAWDWAFGLGSVVPPILFGVAVGNILRGLPLNEKGDFTGTFVGLLNPYALLVGVLTLAMFLTHGALYLHIKTDGDLRHRMERVVPGLWTCWVVLWVVATAVTLFVSPFLFAGILKNPVFWVLFPIMLAAFVLIPVFVRSGRHPWAFLASSISIATQIGLAAVGLFPRMVPARNDLALSLTIDNASSSAKTLLTMLIISGIGAPIVIAYTVFIYRVFKGKVRHGELYGGR